VSEAETRALSRRRLLRGAGGVALGGGAALLAGCGSHAATSTTTSTTTRTPPPAVAGEVDALNHALDIEYRIIAVYTAAIPLLSHRAHAAAKWFLAQELSHVAAVQDLVNHLGGEPSKQASSYNLGHAHGPHALLAFLQELENTQLASYIAVVPLLSTPGGRATVASIVGNEAQHVSILGLVNGTDPVPSALVTGRA